MRVLFDHRAPAPLKAFLVATHTVQKAKDQGWDRISNGDLLKVAEEAGFDILVTTDNNLRYQQNLAKRRISIVVLGNGQWPFLKLHVQLVVDAVHAAIPGSYQEVHIPR